mmetsp:Transcript_23345/g.54289  ORF Transcript_23345/g.54289 Transcript_23345/m.54289 type:complete len:745 (+) Transcript_23345:92-2326(+)
MPTSPHLWAAAVWLISSAEWLQLAEATAAGAEVEDFQCPVRLLSIGTSEVAAQDGAALDDLELSPEGLRYLEALPSPLYIVPMLGVYRGGKSLLLNRLMNLRAPYAGGFGVGHRQETYTRGIHMCGERVPNLGSVVWMDTEGLFSAEDARSAYGPKIFSLALLFSSVVMLNSVKVLNDQFFAYFGEQQHVARVLKQGLSAEGLPQGTLLPANLRVVWVLQQPVQFDASGKSTESQLQTFLRAAGDEYRAHVQRDFRHLHFEVPTASHDVRLWSRLDQLPDDELSPAYTKAAQGLRQQVLLQLREEARPLHAASVAKQLRMYVEAVKTERFSVSLAREAFEDEQIGLLCEEYGRLLAKQVGSLPSASLHSASSAAREALQPNIASRAAEFHFTNSWVQRVGQCLQLRDAEMDRNNQEAVMQRWQAAAQRAAEGGSCFFLGELVVLLKNYTASYGAVFSPATQARAVDYASALQRARLVECVLLRDVLMPFLPWMAWPVLSLHMQGRVLGGLFMAALHTVGVMGLYGVLQMAGQLPPYLNIDYPILRGHPLLLDLAMHTPPMVPWGPLIRAFAALGGLWSGLQFLRHAASAVLPAGHAHMPSSLRVLELKINKVLSLQEEQLKQAQAQRRTLAKHAALLASIQGQLKALNSIGMAGSRAAVAAATCDDEDLSASIGEREVDKEKEKEKEEDEDADADEDDDVLERSMGCPDDEVVESDAGEADDDDEEGEDDDDEETSRSSGCIVA